MVTGTDIKEMDIIKAKMDKAEHETERRFLAKADFDKALVDFPTTPFPFRSKIVAASGGMTASVPYARLNGVSPLLVLGVVL
ncbi:hypothetical protein Tco_0121648 [Tanacetum coccineum]